MVAIAKPSDNEVIRDLKDFDVRSGNMLERLIFNNRWLIILGCLLVTVFLALQMRSLTIAASYEKTLPHSHPYIKNFLDNRAELRGLGESIRIVVEARDGDIFNAEYLAELAKINDEIFILPGVDRPWMKSIFTPVVRWTEVTEEGFTGGPVLPNDYDGSPRSIENLRINIGRADAVGSLVARDYRSSMIIVPLMARDAEGNAVDYQALSRSIEEIRQRHTTGPDAKVNIYVIGFAKLIGDLIAGLEKVMLFFIAAVIIAVAIIYSYTRCIRSTLLVLSCSITAVVWQLGLVALLGYNLDPFSMLVPFLVVAIGVSHGAQKMNGIMQDIGRGTHRLVAARYTFRRLFLAGITALLADVVGFAVLAIIDIPVIRELALTASIGVGVLIFTNLILIPVLLSFIGVSPRAAQRSLQADSAEAGPVWKTLEHFTSRPWAIGALLVSLVLGCWGFVTAQRLQVGDLDAGAPELRADSRYNLDNAFITSHYSISSDVFAVMVKTSDDGCRSYETLTEVDRLGWRLAQVPGVQRTASLADTVRTYTAGMFEGNPKWSTISDNQGIIDAQIGNAVSWNSEFLNTRCTLTPVVAYLADHKADTLDKVVAAAQGFADQHNTEGREFLLAAGNAGVDAATNIVVKQANREMLLYVYAAVALLCLITFRSWRAVIVALLPLVLTSILAEALMVYLGIGVKVATLPVVALGVGIGIDYAIYLLSIQLAFQRSGMSVAEAYRKALATTGKVVALVGVTLAAGVITWAWSPIKFQADMGILLTFMFIWNMLGALILVPALSHFLLQGQSRRQEAADAPRNITNAEGAF
ncbi:MMPL family protein [compost metagenome]